MPATQLRWETNLVTCNSFATKPCIFSLRTTHSQRKTRFLFVATRLWKNVLLLLEALRQKRAYRDLQLISDEKCIHHAGRKFDEKLICKVIAPKTHIQRIRKEKHICSAFATKIVFATENAFASKITFATCLRRKTHLQRVSTKNVFVTHLRRTCICNAFANKPAVATPLRRKSVWKPYRKENALTTKLAFAPKNEFPEKDVIITH